MYRADTHGRPDYYWEYLATRFTSASRRHLEWLNGRILSATGVQGYLHEVRGRVPDPTRSPFFELRYGKRGSVILLPLLYPAGAPCLERKRAIRCAYLARRQAPAVR